MILNTSNLISDEHAGEFFDNKSYEKALKAAGYTAQEAQEWWAKNPTGIVKTPKLRASLNEETGAITIVAPKDIYELPEFKQTFDENALKSYSAAYRTNPSYRVPYVKMNEDGTTEETQITIKEFVEKLNDALKNFGDNYKLAKNIENLTAEKWGDKAHNLSLTQIAMFQNSNADSKRVYIPDFIFNFDNAFKSLENKVSDDGSVDVEKFMGVYNLSKTSQEDLAAIMAAIDGYLRGSNWGDDEIELEDGTTMDNPNSAEQAARALALKNFILSRDPDAEWYQSAGAGLVTLVANAANGFTDVFANTATFAEGLLTFGQSHAIMDWTEEKNETFSAWNEERMLVQDATATLAVLGQIGGYIGGTFAENYLLKAGATKLSTKLNTLSDAQRAKILANAGATGSAAAEALTAESIIGIAQTTSDITAGAKFVLRAASVAEKVNWATNIYKTFQKTHQVMGWATAFLVDTVHDAIVYDAVTLRHVIEGSDDQNVVNYWLGQLSQNAKWWAGLGALRATRQGLKTVAAKSIRVQSLNSKITPKISGLLAKGGDIKQAIKDRVYGGDIITHLEDQIENLADGSPKKNRLINQLNQERLNQSLREARRALSNIDLEYEGLRLTDESLERYQKATDNIRKVELAIDHYNQDVEFKRAEMVSRVKDPSTGMWMYVNPELGAANAVATDVYNQLAKLTAKYNLKVAKHSLLGQDLIDYFVGSQDLKIKKAIAEAGGPDAAKAFADSQVIQANVDSLKLILPEEITDFIDNSGAVKAYTDFYFRLNDYGIARGIVDEELIRSYQNNSIWRENGYMPVQKEIVKSGKFVPEDGRYNALLEEELYHFSYNTAEGQHYVDPEMVRQRRLSNMAKTEVNQDLFKAYRNIEDATNITIISGEETPRVKALKQNKKTLETAVAGEAKGVTENFDLAASKVRRRAPVENIYWNAAERTEAISSFSPAETTQILQQKNVLVNGNKKLSNLVTAENYDDWYRGQTKPVKNYLKQQYGMEVTGTGEPEITIDGNGVKVKRVSIGGYSANIDVEIADRISAMNGDGYTSYNSHSGIGADHKIKSDAGGGYIQFSGKIDDAKKNAIKEAAKKAGMGVDEGVNPLYGPDLTIRQSNTADQALRFEDVIKESNRRLFEHFNVPQELRGSSEWVNWVINNKAKLGEDAFDWREAEIKKIYKEHGGYAQASDKARKKSWDIFFDELGYNKNSQRVVGNVDGNYELFKKAAEFGGDDFEAGLQRAYLIGDEKFADSSLLNEAIDNITSGKAAFYDGVSMASMKGAIKNVQYIDTDAFAESIGKSVRQGVDEYVANVLDTPATKQALMSIADSSENGAELAGKYEALRYLSNKGKEELHSAIKKEVEKSLDGTRVVPSDVKLLVKQANLYADDYVRGELNTTANALRTTNNLLVDNKTIYDEVEDLAREIKGTEKGKRARGADVIMYLDEQGRRVYAEVDPNFASLYNFRYQMTRADAGALAKANASMSKLFRFGTTTLNVTSMGNQAFKDSGRALLVGGAFNTIKQSADNLVDIFGEDIVNQIKRFDPQGYEMRQLKAYAEATGQSLENAAVSRELARGAAVSPASTEATLYRTFMRKAYGSENNGLLGNMRNRIDEFVNRVDDVTNGRRETYLRNRVYANNFTKAMSEGYNLGQARTYAEFAMNNATTNFARSLYHLQAIADSTPYFQSAINGTKSFWRMWSLDPVGITGRIMGGLVLPTMYLTGISLGDPENREIYKNIPEYQKSGNLLFVIDKQVLSIPVPEELSALADPYRQFVEYLYDTNENDFWELMMNDMLGLSPVDLTAFTAIDMDKMINDPTIGDRINRGFARVFSQVAPVPIKSAYMMITGTDPYTGKKLNDPSYVYWDDEVGAPVTMDYTQNAFAKWVADLFGDDASPAVIEKVVSGTVGTTGSNFLGQVVTLFQKGAEEAVGTLATDIGEQAAKPFTVNVYNQADSVWNRAVRALTAEKEAITSSKEWKAIYSELQQTTDESKRKKLMAAGQDMVKEYQKKVITTVERLSSVYRGTYDKKKMAATIQLLNFNSDPAYQSGTRYSSDIASDVFYEGKNMAVATMEALGVKGANDLTIFGYLVTDKETGESKMKYTSPIAIMEMRNVWYGADEIDQANIEAKLKAGGIKTSDMWDGYYKAQAKGKAALKQYKNNWNAKVVKVLAPYISERGVDSVLNNSKTIELLDDYMLVGKYQTKAYLKKIFKNE